MDGHLYNRRRLSTTKVTQTKVSKSKCDGAMLLHKPIFRGVAVSNSRESRPVENFKEYSSSENPRLFLALNLTMIPKKLERFMTSRKGVRHKPHKY